MPHWACLFKQHKLAVQVGRCELHALTLLLCSFRHNQRFNMRHVQVHLSQSVMSRCAHHGHGVAAQLGHQYLLLLHLNEPEGEHDQHRLHAVTLEVRYP